MPEVGEHDELQERLANYAGSGSPRNGRPTPVDKEVIKKRDSLLDHVQWEVLPNGTYIATGYTQDRLPPGAYTLDMTDSGKPVFESKRILTDTLIDLGDSNSRTAIEGIKLFWSRKEQYKKFGILFKRGVLFWGPPGSGKTATVATLISDLIRAGGIVLLVQQPGVAVRALPVLRKIEPERPLIVVLEDVEEIVAAHGEHDLLALLDGEHQTDNVVNLATTNYPEKLGARIVNRPSRFDEIKKIGMPSPQMREVYLRHILGPDTHHPVDQWVADTKELSIAHLKELVVAVTCLEQDYKDVIKRLHTMKHTPKSHMYEEGTMGFGGGNNQLQAGASVSSGR